MEKSERLVFLPEADDDLQAILQEDRESLIRRMHCYILLSDGIILHPAYIWQSKLTNEVLLQYMSNMLSPAVFRILLGDSTTIKEYIADRIEKVSPRKVKTTLYEYHQYKRWGRDIFDQASKLDKTFLNSKPVQLAESRDKKFRRLLTNDVSANIDPYSLYSLISTFLRVEKLDIGLEMVVTKLQEFVQSSDLVSVESFTNYAATGVGLQPLSQSLAFKKRMLDLYYHANVEERVHIPGLRVISERVIDPFDVDIFWTVFAKLFGKKITDVLSGTCQERVTKAVVEMRDWAVWQEFRAIYFSVLEDIEASLWNNTSLVQRRIEDASGYSSVIIVRRIWRERRLQVVAIVFGIIGIAVSPIAVFALPFGLASLFLSAAGLKKAIGRFIHEYHNNELTTLKYRIAQATEGVIYESLKSGPWHVLGLRRD